MTDPKVSIASAGTATLELTDEFAKEFFDKMNFEIEVMRGTKEKMADGRTRYQFEIEDPFKAEMLKKFIVHCMFQDLPKKSDN